MHTVLPKKMFPKKHGMHIQIHAEYRSLMDTKISSQQKKLFNVGTERNINWKNASLDIYMFKIDNVTNI